MPLPNKWIFFLFLILCSKGISGQIYLQLEKANSLNVRRYSAGDHITFRTSEFGENWLDGHIHQILPKEDALVFYDKIVYLPEVTHFQYTRPWLHGLGANTMRFGAAWLTFATTIEGLRRLDAIDTQYEFGVDTAVIGLTAVATGFLVQKIWGRAVKKMNSRNRLRIIDVTF